MIRRLLPAVGLLLALAAGARGEDSREARGRFLSDGNAFALAGALAGETTEPGRTDALLARMAADPKVGMSHGELDGSGSLPDLVAALRRLDLAAAEAAAQRMGGEVEPRLAAWIRALLGARRGREDAAAESLRAAALPAGPDLSFRLALLGAAVPPDDSLLLAAVGRRALLAAAAAGDAERATLLARELSCIERERGAEALVLAARFLRRSGRRDEAAALLAGPEAARSADGAMLALERAVERLVAGDAVAAAGALAGAAVAPWDRELTVAVARGPAFDLRLEGPPLDRHAEGAARLAALAATAATLAGVRTSRDEAAPHVGDGGPCPAGALRRALEARGLRVLPLAGDPRAASSLLGARLPVVLLRPEAGAESTCDRPALLVGLSSAGGVAILWEPDLERAEVIPASALGKARLFAVAPRGAAGPIAKFSGSIAEGLGQVLSASAEASEEGHLDRAIAVLDQAREAFSGIPPFDLYDALARYRAAASSDPVDAAGLRAVREAAERSLASPPALGLEHHLRARRLAVESDPDAALAALEEAVRCSGPTVALARSRFALLAALRRPAAALEAAGEVRRLDPLDDAALYYRGAARARLGDHEGARADWVRALDRRPDSRRVALDLATLELGAGRARATLEILDRLAAADGATRSLEAARDLRRAAEITLVRAARTVAELAPFRASPEPETRRHLAFALRAHETAEAEVVLRGLLADPEVAVRVTALRTYPGPWFRARVEEDAELGAAVVGLLSRDDSPLVRAAAAALLKVVARPFAADALASRLVGPERDPDPYPRSAAAEALGRHDGAAARRTLVEALEDEDATVRRSTIDALFRIASTDHGFDPDGPPERRAESVARWRAWLGTEPNR